MSEITIILLIIVAAVVLFVSNKLPVVVVAMAVGLSLWATGILSLPDALCRLWRSGGDVHRDAFVVSAALEKTGVTAWAGQLLIEKAGEDSRTRLLVLMMSLGALLTAIISLNGAIAALLPVVVVIAVRLKRHASQLLMPLVFAAHAGRCSHSPDRRSTCWCRKPRRCRLRRIQLLRVRARRHSAGRRSMAIIVLFAKKLLPFRNGESMPADFSRHARHWWSNTACRAACSACASRHPRPWWAGGAAMFPKRGRSMASSSSPCRMARQGSAQARHDRGRRLSDPQGRC